MNEQTQFRLAAALAAILSASYAVAGLLAYVDCLTDGCARPVAAWADTVFGVVMFLAVAGLYATIRRLNKRP